MPGKTRPPSIAGRWCRCFNEAPAKCRGKRDKQDKRIDRIDARFNEAPAKCRGKPNRYLNRVPVHARLQ